MYATHPLLVEPSDDAVLWRYMDLAKLLALLDSRTLHLANLSVFDDPFEGHPPRKVVEAFTAIPPGLDEAASAERKRNAETNLRFFSSSRNNVCASCWHMNHVEDAGMWAQYLKTGEGIAVRTTFGALKRALSQSPAELDISGGVVQYVDYETFEPAVINIIAWGALKRVGFDHEREFRLLCLAPAKGVQVPVLLDDLIQTIYVAPDLPVWFHALVTRVAAKYGVTAPVERSALLDDPNYILPAAARGA